MGQRHSWETCMFAVFRNSPHFVKTKISLLCLLQLASASVLKWTNEVLCFQPYYFNFHSDIRIAIPLTHIYWHKCLYWGLPHQKFVWIVFCCYVRHALLILQFCTGTSVWYFVGREIMNFHIWRFFIVRFPSFHLRTNLPLFLVFNTLSHWHLATSKHGKYIQALILEEKKYASYLTPDEWPWNYKLAYKELRCHLSLEFENYISVLRLERGE